MLPRLLRLGCMRAVSRPRLRPTCLVKVSLQHFSSAPIRFSASTSQVQIQGDSDEHPKPKTGSEQPVWSAIEVVYVIAASMVTAWAITACLMSGRWTEHPNCSERHEWNLFQVVNAVQQSDSHDWARQLYPICRRLGLQPEPSMGPFRSFFGGDFWGYVTWFSQRHWESPKGPFDMHAILQATPQSDSKFEANLQAEVMWVSIDTWYREPTHFRATPGVRLAFDRPSVCGYGGDWTNRQSGRNGGSESDRKRQISIPKHHGLSSDRDLLSGDRKLKLASRYAVLRLRSWEETNKNIADGCRVGIVFEDEFFLCEYRGGKVIVKDTKSTMMRRMNQGRSNSGIWKAVTAGGVAGFCALGIRPALSLWA
ncbi:hypothetical protein GGR56DRAFT_518187 [Xylariaceae sp. FL0804]|nr:hypothetical protein GGR56DRAFT_518187 [Xylariaceae sp. FL0804]